MVEHNRHTHESIEDPCNFDEESAELKDEIKRRSEVANILASNGYSNVLVLDTEMLCHMSQEAAELVTRLQDSEELDKDEVSSEAVGELCKLNIVEVVERTVKFKHNYVVSVSSY